MNLTTENILLIGSVLLFISILAGKTSYRFGVPTLIFFLVVGMLAGSEGIGKIYFDNMVTAQFIGVVALNFILFSGGLDTKWDYIKPVLSRGLLLSTVGVLLTTASVGAFVWQVTNFTLLEGLLLGAIVSSTDAAAVFSILRAKSVGLKKNLRPTLELESGSNDPMAYFLTLTLTSLVIDQNQSFLSVIPFFIKQILFGVAIGFGMGKLSVLLINRIRLGFEGLYSVLVISLMGFTFSFTDSIGGNGFLAIYLAAVYIGNHDIIHKKTIMRFFDGIAWLMQIVLFLTLGLLVFPSQILPVIGIGLLISLFMILVARPISVYVSLVFFRLKHREKLFISWVGLRGAVPIVFATYPLIAGVEKANMIFNIVFFISVTSVLLQGTTLPLMAKWLHVAVPEKLKRRTPLDMELSDNVKSELTEIIIPADNEVVGKQIVELGFPKTAIIAMIKRNGVFITPNGSTVLEPRDTLLVLAENEEGVDAVYESLHISEV
ncbi:potassium/proton antiporter [Cesiribacter sp. SM1]|uniref:potassium/proton antiporter n=1 Tax=Cesiribacter sp. SM1 TaxID=2861196 RepID=UPI001CD7E60A|nr:potassium/proton antiporter [Cesiribacter sp. SM1]